MMTDSDGDQVEIIPRRTQWIDVPVILTKTLGDIIQAVADGVNDTYQVLAAHANHNERRAQFAQFGGFDIESITKGDDHG